jgi:hypothetical protein
MRVWIELCGRKKLVRGVVLEEKADVESRVGGKSWCGCCVAVKNEVRDEIGPI